MTPSAPHLSIPSESDIYDRQIRLWGADAQVISNRQIYFPFIGPLAAAYLHFQTQSLV
jgi:hypothetical protein